ncbi:MAG: hypothetical protein ACREKM_13065, partial [Longimicrobiales bacterium]
RVPIRHGGARPLPRAARDGRTPGAEAVSAGGAVWLGMHGAQWLALCSALFTLALLTDAFLGHYRSGFEVRMQYAPFVLGPGLVAAFALALVAPGFGWTRPLLRVIGWATIGLAVIGVAFHYYYGIIEKPGGHRWLLHHLMYHAPLLAPLGLAVAGAMALIVEASLGGTTLLGIASPAHATLAVVVAALVGLMAQVAILHYRGAYNNPAMYAPLVVALGAAGIAIWRGAASSPVSIGAYESALWVVFLTGFAGWGWHLRGLDRMMGGMYVALPNVLEGPPAMAPLLFALLAAQGLVGENLL